MDNKTVKVYWHCPYFVGAYKWQTTEIYEPDECETEFETEEFLKDWEEGYVHAECPRCGAFLYQFSDGAVLAE